MTAIFKSKLGDLLIPGVMHALSWPCSNVLAKAKGTLRNCLGLLPSSSSAGDGTQGLCMLVRYPATETVLVARSWLRRQESF